MTSVQLKWNKSVYSVDIEADSTLHQLQSQIYSLTNVPVERQKILNKGKLVKSDNDVAGITAGSKLMLTGSADTVAAPVTATVFVEDMSDAQRAEYNAKLGLSAATIAEASGLENLGNTCYMNAVIQNLRAIPELKQALNSYTSSSTSSTSYNSQSGIPTQLSLLFKQLDGTTKPVTPLVFTTLFRSMFPQYAERTGEGHFMQQDADELLNTLLSTMSTALTKTATNVPASSTRVGVKNDDIDNIVDYLFSGDARVTLKNTECADEPVKRTVQLFRKLRCHISKDISYLSEGLKHDMVEQIERRSEQLGRNAVYEQSTEIVRLPINLIVQFVRFDWRADTKKKAKILKRVDFPLRLDIQPYCGKELRASLSHARKIQKLENDAKLGLTTVVKASKVSDFAGAKQDTLSAAATADISEQQIQEAEPVDTTGMYELYGVVTHQGRTADGGHYIGWVKQNMSDPSNKNWWKFDDANTSQVSEEDILQLSGGGDHHMAYLLMYRRIDDMVGKEWKITIDKTNNQS